VNEYGGARDGVTMGRTEMIGKVWAAGAGQNAGARIAAARDASYKVRRWGRAAMGKAMCAGRWLSVGSCSVVELSACLRAWVRVQSKPALSFKGWFSFRMVNPGSSQNLRHPAALGSGCSSW